MACERTHLSLHHPTHQETPAATTATATTASAPNSQSHVNATSLCLSAPKNRAGVMYIPSSSKPRTRDREIVTAESPRTGRGGDVGYVKSTQSSVVPHEICFFKPGILFLKNVD